MAYKDFIDCANLGVKNAFLMPTSDSQVQNIGYVELEMFHKSYLDNTQINLEHIQIIMLPAHDINRKYLNNEDMNISELFLD